MVCPARAQTDLPLAAYHVSGEYAMIKAAETRKYEGFAGLDIKLLPILDWRVAEFGYGGLDPFGTYSHNYPIKQVSMGFVLHLP